MLHHLLSRQFRSNIITTCWIQCFLTPFLPMQCPAGHAADFDWVRAHPMASRSEAKETFLLLFAKDGVSSSCICNNVKEMIQGKIYQKPQNTFCQLKQLESYMPWSNAAEQKIKELKKGAGHMLLWSRSPQCLWDDCIELKAYFRFDTAQDIDIKNREVPEVMMSRETLDISHFCKLEWFKWVMFCNEIAPFQRKVSVVSWAQYRFRSSHYH